jgi:hypothetical protein
MTILDAMADPALFRRWFRSETWDRWRVFLRALFALPMTAAELPVYREHTQRHHPPASPAREAWVACGRRAGKSRIAALLAVFLACFRDHRAHLAPGEVATVMVIAADRKQARVVHRYCRALLRGVPMLARMIEGETVESIGLTNGAAIEIHTASYRSTRGYSAAAVIADEVAFWPSDEAGANPDVEIIAALRPSLATLPGSVLLAISSPYSRRGALWDAFRRHHGVDGAAVLTWQADTRRMNPTIDEQVIADAYEQDASAAAAEWGGDFRRDLESFVSREVVEAAIESGRVELPPVQGVRYFAFCDPAGGSGGDSMTLAIAHRGEQADRAVLDCVRERRPPFSPDSVCKEFAAVLKSYGLAVVEGDRYAGSWPAERFAAHGVQYRAAAKPKSEIYIAALPLLNSGKVELLDNSRLVAQLCGLERRTARGGKDSVDHPPRAHDDVINAVCGAIVAAEAHCIPMAPPILTGTHPNPFRMDGAGVFG